MLVRRFLPGLLLALSVGVSAAVWYRAEMPHGTLPTGKDITPIGRPVDVGSFPVNMTLTPDGRYVLVTNSGFRQQLSVLSADTGELVSKLDFNGRESGELKGLYFGVACHQDPSGTTHVAVS